MERTRSEDRQTQNVSTVHTGPNLTLKMHVKGQECHVILEAAALLLTVVTRMEEALTALSWDLHQEHIR